MPPQVVVVTAIEDTKGYVLSPVNSFILTKAKRENVRTQVVVLTVVEDI